MRKRDLVTANKRPPTLQEVGAQGRFAGRSDGVHKHNEKA